MPVSFFVLLFFIYDNIDICCVFDFRILEVLLCSGLTCKIRRILRITEINWYRLLFCCVKIDTNIGIKAWFRLCKLRMEVCLENYNHHVLDAFLLILIYIPSSKVIVDDWSHWIDLGIRKHTTSCSIFFALLLDRRDILFAPFNFFVFESNLVSLIIYIFQNIQLESISNQIKVVDQIT